MIYNVVRLSCDPSMCLICTSGSVCQSHSCCSCRYDCELLMTSCVPLLTSSGSKLVTPHQVLHLFLFFSSVGKRNRLPFNGHWLAGDLPVAHARCIESRRGLLAPFNKCVCTFYTQEAKRSHLTSVWRFTGKQDSSVHLHWKEKCHPTITSRTGRGERRQTPTVSHLEGNMWVSRKSLGEHPITESIWG